MKKVRLNFFYVDSFIKQKHISWKIFIDLFPHSISLVHHVLDNFFLSVILLTKTTSCGREETVFKSSLVYAFTKKIFTINPRFVL